jgi:hypothetical protein
MHTACRQCMCVQSRLSNSRVCKLRSVQPCQAQPPACMHICACLITGSHALCQIQPNPRAGKIAGSSAAMHQPPAQKLLMSTGSAPRDHSACTSLHAELHSSSCRAALSPAAGGLKDRTAPGTAPHAHIKQPASTHTHSQQSTADVHWCCCTTPRQQHRQHPASSPTGRWLRPEPDTPNYAANTHFQLNTWPGQHDIISRPTSNQRAMDATQWCACHGGHAEQEPLACEPVQPLSKALHICPSPQCTLCTWPSKLALKNAVSTDRCSQLCSNKFTVESHTVLGPGTPATLTAWRQLSLPQILQT